MKFKQKPSRNDFRHLLVEALENRQLMAVDLGIGHEHVNSTISDIIQKVSYGVPQSLANRLIEQPVNESIASSLASANGAQVDNAQSSRFGNLSTGLSDTHKGELAKQVALMKSSREAPTTTQTIAAAWNDFQVRSQVAGAPAQVGQAFERIRLTTLDTSNLKSPLFDGNVGPITEANVNGLLSSNSGTSSVTPVSDSVRFSAGWFCRTDGTSAYRSPHPVGEGEFPMNGLGLGDGTSTGGTSTGGTSGSTSGDGSATAINVPAVQWPTLIYSQFDGNANDFVPEGTASYQTVSLSGSFTASTTESNDLTVPGTNWVHIVQLNWIDSGHWSFTETLVMGYSITDGIPEAASSSDDPPTSSGDSSSGEGSSSGDGSNEDDVTGLDVQQHWSTSGSVTRSGFVILSFHAERGMTTAVGAGTSWAFSLNYKDSIGIALLAGGNSVSTPADLTESGDGSSGGGSNSGTDSPSEGANNSPTDGSPSAPTIPQDYHGTASWSLNFGFTIWTAGTLSLSSKPALVIDTSISPSPIVERSFTSGGSSENGVEANFGGGWNASSRSGHTAQPNNAWAILQDGTLDTSIGQARDQYDSSLDNYSPVPKLDHNGHQFGQSGGFNSLAGGKTGGRFNVIGTMKNGRLNSISGKLTEALQSKIGDKYNENEIYTVRDGEGDLQNGDGWTGTIRVGYNISPEVHATLNVDSSVHPTVDSQGSITVQPGSKNDSVTTGGSDGGIDYFDLEIDYREPLPHGSSAAHLKITTQDDGTRSDTMDVGVKGKVALSGSLTTGNSFDTSTPAGLPISTGKFDLNIDGSGFRLVDIQTHSNEDWIRSWVDPYATHSEKHIDIHNLKLKTIDKYKAKGETETKLNADGSTSESGGGNSHSDSDVDYLGYDRVLFDQKNLSTPWSRYIYPDMERTGKFKRHLHFGASVDATRDPKFEVEPVVLTGDTHVIVTGYRKEAQNGSGHTDDIENISNDAVLTWSMVNYGTGTRTSSSGGEQLTPHYDGRNQLEHALDGSTTTSTESDDPYTPPTSYPSNPYSTNGTWWAAAGGTVMGLGQGAVNLVNGVQDVAIGVANVPAAIANTTADASDWLYGTSPHNRIRFSYIPSPDWSRGLVVVESGEPGTWGDMHGWSKFAAGEGAATLLTMGVGKLATAVDDVGNCSNWLSRMWNGGCFVAGTLVTLSELPRTDQIEASLWESEWRIADLLLEESPMEVATVKRLLVPIEEVPLGARVPTKNPRPWEVDDSLPEPDQESWAKISITMRRGDGGIIDAELIRPKWWVKQYGLQAGKLLPLNIEELQVSGSAIVTSVEDCPAIAIGEGAVVTGRFLTREVNVLVQTKILGPSGEVETIEGTPTHPVWSVERQEWVLLGELREGEQVQASDGVAFVISLVQLHAPRQVYNIEVHGEHVYRVGRLGLLVHNTFPDCIGWAIANRGRIGGEVMQLMPIPEATRGLKAYIGRLPQYGGAEVHAFILKEGILFDSAFTKGIEYQRWLSLYAMENGMTVKQLMEFVKIIALK